MKSSLPFFFRFASAAAFSVTSLLTLPLSAVAATEIYKCAGEGGIPVYQDVPCEKGKELRNLTGEDTLSVVPMRVEPSRLPPSPPPAAPPLPAAAPPPTPSAAPAADVPPPSDNTPSAQPFSETPAAAQPSAIALARMAIKPGMTTAEVEASLGPPPMTGGGGSEAPDLPVRWFYFPTEGDSGTITTIVFQRGKVTNVERKPMKKD
ncbi:MAG: DUF4124 domain-containing protein [Burkholderiales bacterium]|jgi:hypothetical protein|nr:DUF4124 domain-containing protein [Burkholderiales bacterium]